jgi:glyoxylase-like metal-dependent hydrolase (beta-lactamase superfamily II)
MSLHIGAIQVDRIEQSMGPIAELTTMFPDLDEATIDRHIEWMAPRFFDEARRHYILSVHSWLVRTPQSTILIDTCSGNHKERKHSVKHHMLNTPYLENLAAAGCRPEDVDYVFCTHLHVDHVGFNTTLVDGAWVPTFPNARHLFARADIAELDPTSPLASRRRDNDQIFADSLKPVIDAGLALLVDDGYEIDGTFRVEAANGHTPGHYAIRATSEHHVGIFSGDAMHHPIQVFEPDLASQYCADPQAAGIARRMILETCARENALLLPAHFAAPHVGRVRAEESSYRFVPGE